MSEYQYYEFLAIDRPLDDAEQAEVRALSTRAAITATTFVNEYHWGDFRGDPALLMERYYDAHLYLANWGTRRLTFRLPAELLDLAVVDEYIVDDRVEARAVDDFIVLDLISEDEAGQVDFDENPEELLPAIVGVRAELAAGDLRPLYLAWLAAYGSWERDEDAFDREADDDLEPPVPPGLAHLSEAQQALATFLRLDDALLAVAAKTSPRRPAMADDPGELGDWVTRLPVAEKDRLLRQIALGDAARARMTMVRHFRRDTSTTTAPAPARRTVGDLLDDAASRRADRWRRLAAERAEEESRRQRELASARERRLDALAREGDTAWSRVDVLIHTRKPADYDAAVALLADLRTLAERGGRAAAFALRATELRQAHARKPSLLDRLDRIGVRAPGSGPSGSGPCD